MDVSIQAVSPLLILSAPMSTGLSGGGGAAGAAAGAPAAGAPAAGAAAAGAPAAGAAGAGAAAVGAAAAGAGSAFLSCASATPPNASDAHTAMRPSRRFIVVSPLSKCVGAGLAGADAD